MNKSLIVKVVSVLLAASGICWACCCPKSPPGPQQSSVDTNSVDAILNQLRQKTEELESYQCRIEYLFSQPLFESKTLRKGDLYYQRCGKKSKLRINFQTLKQDDEKEQKCIEHHIITDGSQLMNADHKLDGIWLVQLDYQIKTVKYRQLAKAAEPNESTDAFDLIGRNFPMVGFAQADGLKKEFEIELVEPKQGQAESLILLRLKVKPDSAYKENYSSVDFWIDKELYLPSKIVAFSTEDDICQLEFIKPKVNRKLGEKAFNIEIPNDFDNPEVIPLDEKD